MWSNKVKEGSSNHGEKESKQNWALLLEVQSADQVRTHLMTEWTTLGIVCSLLGSLAWSAMASPPPDYYAGNVAPFSK